MKHIKLFEEMSIQKNEFPLTGCHALSPRERKILTDLIGNYIEDFYIKVEDHYYYVNYKNAYYNRFDNFSELKDYLLSRYYISNKTPEEYLELLKRYKLDPSFDDNRPIKWASLRGYTEIVKHLLSDSRVDPCTNNNWVIRDSSYNGHKEVVRLLLNDKRVRSKLTEEEINKYTKYTNEIS